MPALQGMAEEDEVYDGAAAPCAIFPILFRNPRVHGSLITYSSTPNTTRAKGLEARCERRVPDLGYCTNPSWAHTAAALSRTIRNARNGLLSGVVIRTYLYDGEIYYY